MADVSMEDLFGSDSEDDAPQQHQGGTSDQEQADTEPQGEQPASQQQQEPADVMKGLFGSDSEGDEQAPLPVGGSGGDAAGATEAAEAAQAQRVKDIFGSDEEDDDRRRSPSPQRGEALTVEAPLHDVLPPQALRLAKLSNIVGIETRPFDPDSYEQEETEYTDDAGNKRIRLQNTIRWRYAPGPDGEQLRQSNARFVRWSDGSLQLLIGDEVLDVREIDVRSDHNYVYSRVPGLLQAQGQLSTKLVFQPASLSSGLHKRLTAAMDKQHTRQQKVRATTTLVDPNKLKAEREKAEAERIRNQEKLKEGSKKIMARYVPPPRRLSAGFLEEEEEELGDEEEEGLDEMAEAQRARMQRARYADERAEREAERRLAAAKAEAPPPGGAGGKRSRAISDSEEEEEEEEGLEDDAEEVARREEMHGFIVDEQEEEEAEEQRAAAASAKKKRRIVMDSDSE